MDDKIYLTVDEFAKAAGISKQAVYKGLNGRLKEYVNQVENKKMLDSRALQEIYNIEIQPSCSTDSTRMSTNSTIDSTQNSTLEEHQSDTESKQVQQSDIQVQLIEMLQQELEQKNKQINDLNARLAEANRNLQNEQKLHAMAQEKIKLLETSDKKENDKDAAAIDLNVADVQNDEEQQSATECNKSDIEVIKSATVITPPQKRWWQFLKK